MKKAVALIVSAVLCLGVSATVLAAENPSVTDPVIPEDTTTPEDTTIPEDTTTPGDAGTAEQSKIPILSTVGQGTDKNGNKVTVYSAGVSKEVEEILSDEKAVKNILTEAGYKVTNDQKAVVIGAGDFKLYPGETFEPGTEMSFWLGSGSDTVAGYNWDSVKDIKNGDVIYVLHQTADGTWEVLEGVAVVENDGDWKTVNVKVAMTGFSPVAFIKVMSNGEVVVLDKAETKVTQVDPVNSSASGKVTTTEVTTKTSPKTGEW